MNCEGSFVSNNIHANVSRILPPTSREWRTTEPVQQDCNQVGDRLHASGKLQRPVSRIT